MKLEWYSQCSCCRLSPLSPRKKNPLCLAGPAGSVGLGWCVPSERNPQRNERNIDMFHVETSEWVLVLITYISLDAWGKDHVGILWNSVACLTILSPTGNGLSRNVLPIISLRLLLMLHHVCTAIPQTETGFHPVSVTRSNVCFLRELRLTTMKRPCFLAPSLCTIDLTFC